MPTLQAEAKQPETRHVKAKDDHRTARELVQVVSDQADAISAERNHLKEDLKHVQNRIKRRNKQLKATRKALQKEKKKLELSEERFFTTIYEMMVRRVAEAGLDHKLILLEVLDVPIGKEPVPEEPLVVFSDPEEDLYD